MPTIKNAVEAYYDENQFYYTHFWSRTALHYGLWYEDTPSLAVAITNTNKLISESLDVDANDHVLDAGCGVGGTAIHLAETTGAHVTGITLSGVQLRIARAAAARSCSPFSLSFAQQDFTRTKFKDSAFTKIYGVESICYANDKLDFLREAYRLLAPGGRLAVVDTFLTKEALTPAEARIYELFLEGWVVPNLATRERFADLLASAGFRNTVFRNLQQYIWRSVKRVFLSGLVTCPVNVMKSWFGLVPRNLSAIYQKRVFNQEIAMYGLFIAEKPRDVSTLDDRFQYHNEERYGYRQVP